MRTISSLPFTIIGLLFFNAAVDELAGALTHAKQAASFPEAAIWAVISSIIAGFAFRFALRARGAIWAIVLPCGIAAAFALFLALILQDSQIGIVGAAMVGLTVVMAQLGRVRAEQESD